jgi:hypothetical protein
VTIPSDSEALRKKFEDAMVHAIPDRWERYAWVHTMEERFGTLRWHIDPGTAGSYYIGVWCFVFGQYPATVVMIGAAVERWLRWLVEKDRADLKDLIALASSRGKLSNDLTVRLERLRDSMRNPAAHGKDEVMMQILGWRKIQPHGWVRPEEYSELGNAPAAKEAIETFLLLIQETIPGGP